jgi:uncharacterized repeat protein (TIGR03803 family)
MKPLLRLLELVFLIIGAANIAVHAQNYTYSVLLTFGEPGPFYGFPAATEILAQGRDGNLYSTTPSGGANNSSGTVYKITPAGQLTVLYSLCSQTGCVDGAGGDGGLTLGTDGNFYGTTAGGGSLSCGFIFKITPAGSYTVLYNFTGGNDGCGPTAPPIRGNDGSFYGTASTSPYGTNNDGALYKITPSGKFTILHDFNGTDGKDPAAPLVLGSDGNFYGTTYLGGSGSGGTVFKMTPSGKLTTLYNFCSQTNCTDGNYPAGGLVQGGDGNFYGTTQYGGSYCIPGPGCGTIFKITPTGRLTTLHAMNSLTDGNFNGWLNGNSDHPDSSGLVLASDGNFYGAASGGGPPGCECGTLFKITPGGSFSVIHVFGSFQGDGEGPGPMMQNTNGILYGTTDAVTGGGSACPSGGFSCAVFYNLNASLPAFVKPMTHFGKVGSTIEFLGQGFDTSTTVSFNGTPATPTVVSGTYLTAKVPNGATSGFVTVNTSVGTLTSDKQFRVTPQIESFNPPSGPVGTVVTIAGVSLTQATKVTFGGKSPAFTVNSDIQVTATVPTGAVTGRIVITTPGGTASSPTSFTVTQ